MDLIGTVQNCGWRELAERVRAEVGMVDALIVDAPYSERTHKGHDSGVVQEDAYRGAPSKRTAAEHRRELNYAPWNPDTVGEFAAEWVPLVRGWVVSITDHVLAPVWAQALERCGMYAFSPLACVRPGSRIRLSGDGPAQWAEWAVVARPRTREMQRWGALPGAYVVPAGEQEPGCQRRVVGAKPLWLMESLVRDYTRPGDLVCDPCAGGGTTLLAAKLLGRRYVGGDISLEHVHIAEERLRDLPTHDKRGTLALFGGGK